MPPTTSLRLLSDVEPDHHATDALLLADVCPLVPVADWLRVLSEAGGLRALVLLPDVQLLELLPQSAVTVLRAVFLVNERFRSARDGRPVLATPQAIYEYVRPHLDHHPMERFIVLAMNARNRLLGCQVVAEGSVDQCHVDPRKVFAFALRVGATGIVLAHSHPSGDPEPSQNDVALTRQLRDSGRMLCVRVLDHLVLGEDRYVSMLARGHFRGGDL